MTMFFSDGIHLLFCVLVFRAAALCLSPTHEFRFMLVNQIQRDMNRSVLL
jgi:hypothetical protein